MKAHKVSLSTIDNIIAMWFIKNPVKMKAVACPECKSTSNHKEDVSNNVKATVCDDCGEVISVN